MVLEKIHEFKAAKTGVNKVLTIGEFIFSCDSDDFLRKWDISNYNLLKEVKAHDKNIQGICKSPNLSSLLSYSDDGSVKEFDLELRQVFDYPSHEGRVNDLTFIDKNRFITASDDATVRIYKLSSYSFKEKDLNIGDIESVCVVNGKVLIGGSKLIVCDLDLEEIASFDNDYIYGIDFIYTDGKMIYLSRSMEKKLEVRDINMNLIKIIRMPSWIKYISSYLDYLFVSVSDQIIVYDKEFREIAISNFSSSEINSFAFYDKNIIIAFDDGYIRIWKINI
ncbi:MAG: hypothetical protein N2446_01695 [Elusimicrobiales bacterium]|nr:hypothetical protein [Elusimicrobiales bacterium]